MRDGYKSSIFPWRTLCFLFFVIVTYLSFGCTSPGGGDGRGSEAQTYTLSGIITPTVGGSGAAVTLSGADSATTTVNSSGIYSFTGLGNGSYFVVPSKNGFTFNPTTQSVTINNASVTGVNFTATAVSPTHTISGSITPASVSAGATVTLSGAASLSSTADSSGNYSFTALANGAYKVTPSSQTATFSPISRSVTISNGNVSGVNFSATAIANSGCGATLDWTYAICQTIASGTLNSQWTVVSRHGEYSQSETECNVPQQITQTPGALTITAIAQSYTCGDFNTNGTNNRTPASWPYMTGDIQMNTFSFSPSGASGSANCLGTCTITIVGSMPSSATHLWPAYWLLGSNCQDSNKYSGDTGFDGCPNLGQSGYTEIDMVECYNGGGWCQFHVANPNFGIGNGCDATYTVDTNQHTFQTVWTASSIKQYMDGKLETTCNQSITNPMFMIFQIQTGGAGGTPANSQLPASMVTNSVKITDASGATIFSDDFTP